MIVKDVIQNSNVEVNDEHTSIDCNAIPCSSTGGVPHEPGFEFADIFISLHGDAECEPIGYQNIDEDDLPAELILNGDQQHYADGLGTVTDYVWYKTTSTTANGREYDIIFGVW